MVLAGFLVPASAQAAPPSISHADARDALADATAALHPVGPLSAGGPAGHPIHATAALRDLAVVVPALNRAERRRANELLRRPTDKNDRGYFGKEAPDSPICTGRFCIHFTNARRNAPDSDAFLDEVIDSVDKAYAIENGPTGLDWRDAKPDGTRGARDGRGGDGQVDVYITNLGSNLYGYAAPDPGQRGPKRFAYLVLDNDYVGFPSPPIASLKVTVAHEYNHILQFGYDIFQDLWMFETTATWAEQKVYPSINDYLNYLPVVARYPHLPLTGRDKIYGEAVWNHWLEARYGPDVIRDAWSRSVSVKPAHFAVAAYQRAIQLHGGRSFSAEFAAYATETAEWRSSPLFPDSARYPDVTRRLRVGPTGRRLRLDNTSYSLGKVRTRGSGPVKLIVKAAKGTRSSLALVGRKGPADSGAVTSVSDFLARGGRGAVELPNPGSYDRITAVVINADGRRGGNGYRKDDSRYRVRLSR